MSTVRPRLRPLDTIVVPDDEHGKVLVLRDTQGIAPGVARIPPDFVPIVGRFDGELTCEEIAALASKEIGEPISATLVEKIARELDEGFFLEGGSYRAAREKIAREFAAEKVRATSHAGGAYSNDPDALTRYLDEKCIARANGVKSKRQGKNRSICALIAPHIDPWRGALDYGHAYGALADRLAASADTFILFGTSHAPMRQPFALCNKSFDTPLGALHADDEALTAIAARAKFDPYADELFHKREHSLEFQVVFLKHILKQRKNGANVKIVPILAALGEHQARGTSPETDSVTTSFLDGVRELVDVRGERVVVIAGADLAHVGPRFGDKNAYDESARSDLEARDHESLAWAIERDAAGFWNHVSEDNETRRVCGLAPIYALLKTLASSTPSASAETLHYEQTIDEQDGSIVSHASVAFFR